jgi:hypothetical protein
MPRSCKNHIQSSSNCFNFRNFLLNINLKTAKTVHVVPYIPVCVLMLCIRVGVRWGPFSIPGLKARYCTETAHNMVPCMSCQFGQAGAASKWSLSATLSLLYKFCTLATFIISNKNNTNICQLKVLKNIYFDARLSCCWQWCCWWKVGLASSAEKRSSGRLEITMRGVPPTKSGQISFSPISLIFFSILLMPQSCAVIFSVRNRTENFSSPYEIIWYGWSADENRPIRLAHLLPFPVWLVCVSQLGPHLRTPKLRVTPGSTPRIYYITEGV